MILAIAHRANAYGHRENTVPALFGALEQGADAVEVDLKLTRDGHVILLHDPTLKRLWRQDAAIERLSLAELNRLAEDHYEVPTFERVLAMMAPTDAALLADFTEPAIAEGAVEMVGAHHLLDRVIFCSRDLEALQAVRKASDDARIAVSWARPGTPDLRLLADLGAEFYNPSWRALEPAAVDRCHAEGFKVSVWTVDSPTNMSRLISLGVDAIITNRLQYLLALLRRRPLGRPKVA